MLKVAALEATIAIADPRHSQRNAIVVGIGQCIVVALKPAWLRGVTSRTLARPPDKNGKQLALARGHRWLAMLESGEAKSLKEIATREGIDNSYVSRMFNLTTLAPDIVAAILDDALPNYITLFDLAVDPPALWDEQRERVGL
ncbi:MAG: hypothetical protein IE913_09295 [Halothiobacillus sp.]|nr:hypothetical protein [Halothiobacillus sp.]